jgi:hypothetical protein
LLHQHPPMPNEIQPVLIGEAIRAREKQVPKNADQPGGKRKFSAAAA